MYRFTLNGFTKQIYYPQTILVFKLIKITSRDSNSQLSAFNVKTKLVGYLVRVVQTIQI